MNCSKCNKIITGEYVWKSIYDVYKDNIYCSPECCEKDNKIEVDKIRKTNMLKRWKEIKSALYYAIELMENNEVDVLEEFNVDYPNIYEIIELFDKSIMKDIK